MQDSIFTKIIRGELPAHKLYEDEHTLALLDIHPISPGHTLVIPKQQVEFIWDLPEQDYQALMRTAQKIAVHLREALKVPYVGAQIVGVDVPHAHIHLIPFSTTEEFRHLPDLAAEPNHEELSSIAQRLAL